MLQYPFQVVPAPAGLCEVAPGVHWLRMPLPMALDHINLYLLEDGDGWWIIDTGMSAGDTEHLWREIFERHLGGKPVKAVMSTHWHPDHTGMAGWLCDHWRVPFYITRGEYLTGLVYSRSLPEHFSWTNEQYSVRCGRAPEAAEQTKENMGGLKAIMHPLPTSYFRLEDGVRFTINGHRWRIVVGSGHSPEHACLFCESLNVLISGDQVIPRISSNVSVSGTEPEGNPLKEWLNSLQRFIEILPPDALVLPAHNKPFRGLHHRLRHLIEHHEEHLIALEEACVSDEPRAIDLLPVLFKRELDAAQVGLALGECVAHLNYLCQRGQLSRRLDQSGAYRYRSVDDTLSLRLRVRKHRGDGEVPMQV